MKNKFYLCCAKETNYEIVESKECPKTSYYGGKFWMRGRGYNTLEDLIIKENVAENPCCECKGVVAVKTLDKRDAKMMAEMNICSSCLFWYKILQDLPNKRRVIIGGNSYYIKSFENVKTEHDHVLGFGGRKFRIKKHNGEEIFTNNLWGNGAVPKLFSDRIKNNAEFIYD